MSTLFLATVIGWYLVIVSLLILFRHEQIKAVTTEILGQRGLFFIIAIMTVILGLLMVVSHNIWVTEWPLVITLISWLVLLSGLIRLFFPDTTIKMARAFTSHPVKMKITSLVLLLLGLFLLFRVYSPFL